MIGGTAQWNELPREIRETLRPYLEDVSAVFGSSLEAVVLYGSAARGDFRSGLSNLNLIFLLKTHDVSFLEQYAKRHRRWTKEGIVVPLFLTEQELRTLVDLFPLEFLELSHARMVLTGRDPFVSLHPDPRRLSVQCLQEIRGNLLRLRQRFVEGGGSAEAIQVMIPLSITALLPALRGLATILNLSMHGSAEELLGEVQKNLDLDLTPLVEALRLKYGAISPGIWELPRLFARYATTVEALGDRASKALAGGSL